MGEAEAAEFLYDDHFPFPPQLSEKGGDPEIYGANEIVVRRVKDVHRCIVDARLHRGRPLMELEPIDHLEEDQGQEKEREEEDGKEKRRMRERIEEEKRREEKERREKRRM